MVSGGQYVQVCCIYHRHSEHDDTISNLLNPVTRIHNLLEKQNQKIGAMQLTMDHDTDSEIKG